MQRWAWPSAIVMGLVLLAPPVQSRELRDPARVVRLEGLWLFRPGDNPSFARPQLDDLHWLERRVPTTHTTWSERWADYGWYRLHLELSKAAANQDAMLSVGPVREAVQVYVNGSLVAVRGGFGVSVESGSWALPLSAVVPSGLLHEGDNVIAVRVYDPNYTGGLVSGPMVFGHLETVQGMVRGQSQWILLVRVGLAALALFLGLGQALLMLRRGVPSTGWWLAAAGGGLAIAHLTGLGLFSSLGPAELTSRLPTLATMLSILAMGSYYAGHYDDLASSTRTITRVVLLAITTVLMLMPAAWHFFVAPPTIFLVAMVTTLYTARLCVQAVRRSEAGALPEFLALAVLGVAVVFDGFVLDSSDLLPAKAVMTAVLVLAITCGTQLRQTIVEHRQSLLRVQRLSQRLGEQPYDSLMDATVMPMLDPEEFLATSIHEVARDMEVRRCSLVLNHSDGRLRIRASVGLPSHLAREVVEPHSISGYVFRQGVAVTTESMPQELKATRHGYHSTDAFMSVPVMRNDVVLGVLNVSDRNDGKSFKPEDEEVLWALAEHMALAISILAEGALDPPPVGATARLPQRILRRRTSKARRLTTRRRPSQEAAERDMLAEVARVAEGGLSASGTPWATEEDDASALAATRPATVRVDATEMEAMVAAAEAEAHTSNPNELAPPVDVIPRPKDATPPPTDPS